MSYQPAGEDEVTQQQQHSAAQPNPRTRRSRRVSQSSSRRTTNAAPSVDQGQPSMALPPSPSSANLQRRQSRKRPASNSISHDAQQPPNMRVANAPNPNNVVLTRTGRLSKALKGVKAHQCEHCGKIYSRAEHLRRHQRNHRPSPLQCDVCSRTFFREDLLSRHITKYHNPNGEQTTNGIEDAAQSQRSSTEPNIPSDSSQRRMSTQDLQKTQRTNSAFNIPPIDDIKPAAPLFSDPTKTPWPTDVTISQQSSWDPLLIPASSAVSNTWIQPQPYPVGTLAPGFVDSADPYSFTNFEWSGLTSLQSPVSDSAPIWDQHYYIDLDMAGLNTTRSSPAPISAVPPLLMPVASHSSDEGVQDPQLGLMFSKDRQRTYLDAYWRYFHPKFPILHQRKFSAYKAFKGLLLAIMAVGAQFTQDMFAATDSRILLERCLDAFCKNKHIPSNMPLEFMQAVVLLEFLYHFKAKRAPDHLSEMFMAVYDKLWEMHTNTHSKVMLDAMHDVANQSGEGLNKQWLQWIDVHSKERLLAACFILDSRHALLFGRQNHAPAISGLNLFVPLPNVVWDILECNRWAQTVKGTSFTNTYVIELLDAVQSSSVKRCDIFSSSFLVACYASSLTCQKNSSGFEFVHPTHLLFGACSHLLPAVLSNCPAVRLMTLVVELINLVPFRALIATASESWVFSKRLAGDAGSAAEEFARLKQEMRSWTSGSPQVPMYNNLHGQSPHQSGSFTQAVSIAIMIIKEAINAPTPHLVLVFGPDLAIYFATLVLWAATFAATPHIDFAPQPPRPELSSVLQEQEYSEVEASIKKFVAMAPNHILAPVLRSQSSPSVLSMPQGHFSPASHNTTVPGSVMDMPTQHFVPISVPPSATLVPPTPMPLASLPLSHSSSAMVMPMTSMVNTSIIRPDMIGTWRTGVEAILKWTARQLAAPAQQNSGGAGELMEGAIGVLEKLGSDGWVGHWF